MYALKEEDGLLRYKRNCINRWD